MITYELTKELKDTGFDFRYIEEGENMPFLDVDMTWMWHTPTLSELIEACGNRIESLIHDIGAKEWTATQFQPFGGMGIKIGRGKTPEESVARLWLALNKTE